MSSSQEKRVAISCDVHVSLPEGLDRDDCDRFDEALHAADRKLGVIWCCRYGRAEEVVLMTSELDERAARRHAEVLLAEAARPAGISEDQLDRAEITQIVRRRRNLTGRPRRVEAPAGRYETVDLGDRGQLSAMHEGPLGDWVVYLEPEKGRAWAGRNLLAVLSELFELPHGAKQVWVYEVIEKLAGHRTPLGIRYPCPCCDHLTLTAPPSGSFAICPVCWWEDDCIQFSDVEYKGGANTPSLLEARATYQRIGVCEARLLEHARPPLAEEKP